MDLQGQVGVEVAIDVGFECEFQEDESFRCALFFGDAPRLPPRRPFPWQAELVPDIIVGLEDLLRPSPVAVVDSEKCFVQEENVVVRQAGPEEFDRKFSKVHMRIRVGC